MSVLDMVVGLIVLAALALVALFVAEFLVKLVDRIFKL